VIGKILKGVLLSSVFLSSATLVSASTSLGWESLPSMPLGRYGAVGAPVGNKVYLIGGVNNTGGCVSPVSEYNISTGLWTQKNSTPTLRTEAAGVLGPDGKIYVIGGLLCGAQTYTVLNTLEIYNPVNDTWATGSAMPTPRSDLAAVFGSNGKLYAIGGLLDSNNTSTDVVEEYDPASDAWIIKSPLNYASYGLGATLASDSYIYIAGGSPQQGVERFDTINNTWILKSPPSDTFIHSNFVLATNGRLYLIGAPNSNYVDEYYPPSDTWVRTTGLMPTEGFRLVAVEGSDGKLYRFGGQSSNTSISQYVVERATITLPADVLITMTDSPDPVVIRKALTYSVTVTNSGPGTATNVTTLDTLVANTTFVSATPSQGTCTGTTTITCNLGSLNNGSSATITIIVKPTSTGVRNNTVTASANEPDDNLSNNTATVSTTVTKK